MNEQVVSDPYPFPFEWHPSIREVAFMPLESCGCENGWLPLLSGEFIECVRCKVEEH